MTDPITDAATGETSPSAARRPLLSLAACAMLGWLAGLYHPGHFSAVAGSAAVLLVAVFLRARTRYASVALHAAVLAVTFAHASLCERPPGIRALSSHVTGDRRFIEIAGGVADEPVQLESGSWRFPLHVEGVRKGETWLRAGGVVDVTARFPERVRPVYGERWQLAGVAVPRPLTEASVVLKAYAGAVHLDGFSGSRFHAWLLERRDAASRLLGLGFKPGDASAELDLLRALLLGERAEMDVRTRQAFARTGTLHIIAISGSHIAAFLVLLVALAKACGRPRTTWFYYVGPFLALYVLATGMSPSAVRAGVMALVLLAGPSLRRRTDGATALAAAALAILVLSPHQLLDRGFVLSFLIVAGLMLLYRPILGVLSRWLPGDPWQLEHPPAIAAARWFLRNVYALLAASLAAWLVSLPLTACFFNLYSPVGLLANLAVVPLSFVILLTGCLSFAAGSVVLPVAEIFNHANVIFVKLMLGIVAFFNGMPGAYSFVQSPPVWQIIVYYVLLLGCVLLRGRLRLATLLVSLAAVAVVVTQPYWSGSARLVCWRNPGALSTLLELPGNRQILINTGRAFGAHNLVRTLHARGVDQLDVLVLTAASADVLGASGSLLDEIPAREVWLSAADVRSPSTEAFLARCVAQGVKVRRLVAGDEGEFPGAVTWTVLHPERGTGRVSALAAGLVLRIARGTASTLILGSDACDELARKNRDMDADVLVDANGAGAIPLTLLDRVRPRWMVHAGDPLADASETAATATVRRVSLDGDACWSTEWPLTQPGNEGGWPVGTTAPR